jgi:hypothetical protein
MFVNYANFIQLLFFFSHGLLKSCKFPSLLLKIACTLTLPSNFSCKYCHHTINRAIYSIECSPYKLMTCVAQFIRMTQYIVQFISIECSPYNLINTFDLAQTSI